MITEKEASQIFEEILSNSKSQKYISVGKMRVNGSQAYYVNISRFDLDDAAIKKMSELHKVGIDLLIVPTKIKKVKIILRKKIQ